MLNRKTCLAEGSANTGFGDCFLNPSFIVGMILIPKDREYTPVETATKETIAAAILADTRAIKINRAYPITNLEAITDNSEEASYSTLGYGSKSMNKEGDYDWSFQFVKGGICLNKSLRKFNGSSKSALFYDENGTIFGVKSGVNLKGVPLASFYVPPFKIADGSNATDYRVRVAHKPNYLNDSIGFVECERALLDDIDGLQDVVLSTAVGSATPIFKIKATTGCSGDDLYELYSTELADESLWIAKGADGSVLTITSVVVDPALQAWTVTVDGVAKTIALASASALETAGVNGFESLVLSV